MTIFNNETVAEAMNNHKMAINITLLVLGSATLGIGLSFLGISTTVLIPLALIIVSMIGIGFALNNPHIPPITHTNHSSANAKQEFANDLPLKHLPRMTGNHLPDYTSLLRSH